MWSGWQMWTVSFERIFLAASSTTVLASLARPELSTACYHRAKVRTLGNTFSIDQQNITYQYITSIQSFQPTVAVRWTKLVIWNCSLVAFSSMGFSEKKPPAAAASDKMVTMKPWNNKSIPPPVALTTVAATTAAKASETTCPSWRQANISSYPWRGLRWCPPKKKWIIELSQKQE